MRITAIDGENVENINCQIIDFPGGEVQTRLDLEGRSLSLSVEFMIRADIRSHRDVMALLMATDALRRAEPGCEITLLMPYIPYARQDRVTENGEALSIKVFADLINSQGYAQVAVWDAHSDVSLALIDRVKHFTAAQIIADRRLALSWSETPVIVAPDAGGFKRAAAVAKMLGADLCRAEKARNTKTGEITGTRIVNVGEYGEGPFLIVDDICDGGRTFIELAREIKRSVSQRPISLYVTHGIFSAGFDSLAMHVDHIYCPNVLYQGETPDFLTKI